MSAAFQYISVITTLPETNSSHLTMDAWNTNLPFWDFAYVQVRCHVSFRECSTTCFRRWEWGARRWEWCQPSRHQQQSGCFPLGIHRLATWVKRREVCKISDHYSDTCHNFKDLKWSCSMLSYGLSWSIWFLSQSQHVSLFSNEVKLRSLVFELVKHLESQKFKKSVDMLVNSIIEGKTPRHLSQNHTRRGRRKNGATFSQILGWSKDTVEWLEWTEVLYLRIWSSWTHE